MVRRRGIRRHLTRNRSIALVVAIGAFVVVIGSGVDIGIDIFQGGAFQGTTFNVRIFDQIIPLAFIDNFAVECDFFTKAQLAFTNGQTRDIGTDYSAFTLGTQQFGVLAVFDPITGLEVLGLSGETWMRCRSPTPIGSFVIEGGTVEHFFEFAKTDDGNTRSVGLTPTTIPRITTTSIFTNTGVKLDSFLITADDINNVIQTNDLDYFANIAMLTSIDVSFSATANGMTDFDRGTFFFWSWKQPQLKLRITNDDTGNPFTPADNTVRITKFQNSQTSGLGFASTAPNEFDLDACISGQSGSGVCELFLQVLTLNRESFEGKPQYTITRADSSTGKPTGSILFSGTVSDVISNDENSEFIQMPSSSLQAPQVYVTIASSVDRTGTDTEWFFTSAEGQIGFNPPEDPDPIGDPCEGFTGSELEQCEIARGKILVCDDPPYKRTSRVVFDAIVSVPAVIVQTQPGLPAINEFTTIICVHENTIDQFNKLGGGTCNDPNFIFDDDTGKCVCGFTGSTDLEAECTKTATGTLSAKSLMLFEIAYNGASDVGSIRDVEGTDIIFAPLLSLAGEIAGKEEIYALARLQVNPVIDWNDVDSSFGDPKNSVFIFKLTGKITRTGTTEQVELPKALEICFPRGFNATADFTEQSPTISPSTTCENFNMSTVGVVTGGGNLGLRVEDDIQGGRFYQIARSDIQPSEIITALGKQSVVLKDGDKFEITIEVEGSFQVGTGSLKRIGVVTPMTFSHEFTWVEVLNPEPCSGLSGEAKIKCLGGSFAAGGTCSAEENNGVQLTALECYRKNNPILPKTNPGDPDCRQAFVGGLIRIVCEGDPEEKKSGLGGDPDDDSGGDPGTVGTCASGATATECLKLTIADLQSQITALLGLGGDTITTLSNNAVLIIAVVIAIIVIALIVQRAVVRTRQKRLGRKLLGL